MNLTELLVESKPLNERPVGMLKGIGQSIAAKVLPGSYGAKAAGARDAGKVANQLYKEFFNFIGRTGDKPTNVSLAAFLKSVGVNDTIIGKYTGSNQTAPATTQAPAAPATKGRTGGKIAGQVSSTPGAIKRRNDTAAKKAAAKPTPESRMVENVLRKVGTRL